MRAPRPRKRKPSPKKIDRRFDAKVMPELNSGCWLWTGAVNVSGYGLFYIGWDVLRAHRYSYERANGKLKDGQVVMHKCDNPICVNPSHLAAGSQLENIADMIAKKRARRGIFKGEDNASAKLTEGAVRSIRASSMSLAELSMQYDVAKTTVWCIKTGKSWRHI
jgi:hypothetical protein